MARRTEKPALALVATVSLGTLVPFPAAAADFPGCDAALQAGTADALRAFLLANPDSPCSPLARRALVDRILQNQPSVPPSGDGTVDPDGGPDEGGDGGPDFPVGPNIYP
jgi:hypothetical protein